MAAKDDIPAHFRDWDATEGSPDTMEKPAITTKPLWRRPWFIGVATAATIAILVAIIVPLAVLLPKKGKSNHSIIILPLYIYPTNASSWQPLYDSLDAQKDREFTLIINPSSGPGNSDKPDEQYSSELIKLSAYPNVNLVGYVRTGYASRNLSDVLSEVSTYGEWASSNMSFAMGGIFFDESPHQYSAEAVEFMRKATQAVKNTEGLQGQKTVIRNPGVIPDPAFDDSNTDVSVVFEQSYDEYQGKKSDLKALSGDRSKFCYMVHSLPSMAKDGLRGFVGELSKHAKFLFVTTNAEHYYESFGSDWADFTDVVPK